jgi:serine/threonine protein kinase
VDFLDKCFKRDPKRRWTAEELLNHPFVSRNSMRTHPRKQHTCSPASVFDIGIYDSDDYDDSESTNGEELPCKNPFSRSCGERKTTARREQAESDLASSEIWITVRSGGCF